MAKQLETVSGLVEQVNAKGTGIKVAGQWVNASQFHSVTLPQAGQRVDVQVERTDRGAWIQAVDVLDGGRFSRCRSSRGAEADGRRLSSARFDVWRYSRPRQPSALAAQT